jgi:hypothetical protein
MPVDVADRTSIKRRILLHPDPFVTLEAANVTKFLNFAETCTQRQMLAGLELLIAEEQHLVGDPGRAQFREQGVVSQGIRHLYAVDGRAECPGDRVSIEVSIAARGERLVIGQGISHACPPSTWCIRCRRNCAPRRPGL